jgi:hypothetical protein
MQAREHRGRRAAGREVGEHRRRDLGRIRRHTMLHDRMIGREDQRRGRTRQRPLTTLQRRQLHDDPLELTEAARRLGQARLPQLGPPPRLGVELGHGPWEQRIEAGHRRHPIRSRVLNRRRARDGPLD